MLIDWFTVGAQALNFLILVWLLKKFLYQPVLRAINDREARIAKELADAAAKQAEAGSAREEFTRKNLEFDQQRSTLLAQATAAADSERKLLLDAAQQAADDLRVKRQQAMAAEVNTFKQHLGHQTRQQVFALVRKALAELADASLEARMVEVFIRRLHAMDDITRTTLATALSTLDAAAPARVRSTFDLSADQRKAIQSALNTAFASEIPLQFDTDAELVSGIELTVPGQKLGWNIADYLAELEQTLADLLVTAPAAVAKP